MQTKYVKISIIMPVYNMQEYIVDAIESFLSQSIKEKELLCIDDCSLDDSLAIIKKYASDYENIHVYELDKNRGAGAARRKGIQFAAGEYIGFLDADDLFGDRDALEKLYNGATEDQCDMCGGLITVRTVSEEKPYPRFRSFFNGNANAYKRITNRNLEDDFYFSAFIYKKIFLLNEDIQFPQLRLYEDPPFLLRSYYDVGVTTPYLHLAS